MDILNFATNLDLTNSAAIAAITAIFLFANRVVTLKLGIPFLVTAVCGGSSLFMILSNDPVDPWAYAVVGAFIGYWMRNKAS
tara:strand:- start:6644 stop:6889 length:246 start_codon:yes stop_codon:yes gene_type:complete